MDLKEAPTKFLGSEDERAVSPVIGVVLMVAVTVILAAVIAAFVMGMGDDLGSSASPTLSADASTNENWGPDASGTDNYEVAYVSHSSGDSIDMEDVRVIIRDQNGGELASVDGADVSENGGSDSIDSSGDDVDGSFQVHNGDDEFSGGSTFTIEADDGAFNGDDEFEVNIVDIPSGTTVVESTLTVP